MSFKAIAFATEQEVTRTSPQSHLLLILASYANDQDECYPSINTIVNKTRMSDKTVRKCLKELIELGLIADTQKTTRFGTKIYKIILNDNKDLTHSKSTTPSKSTTGKYSSTPSKSTSTPLVNLPPNPVIESVKESESNARAENQNQKSGEPLELNLDEIKNRFAMAGIIPSTFLSHACGGKPVLSRCPQMLIFLSHACGGKLKYKDKDAPAVFLSHACGGKLPCRLRL